AKEKFWQRLAAEVEPSLLDDERFVDFASRRANEAALLSLLSARFEEKTSAEWLTILTDAGVPCGPVNDVHDALLEAQVAARGMVIETDHPRFGAVRQIAGAVRAGKPRADHRRGPRLGEDSRAILNGLLLLDEAAVDDLASRGAFGDPEQTRR